MSVYRGWNVDITAGLKPTYAVTLNLPDEPDLTGKNIIYTYTNKDNSRYMIALIQRII